MDDMQWLAELAQRTELTVTGPSIGDVRSLIERRIRHWPGCTYRITPDPVKGVITATVRRPSLSESELLTSR